jgi:hypothetical protein
MPSRLRFTDFHVQVVLTLISLIAILTMQPAGIFLSMIGTFFLGIWQVLSALFHTISFYKHPFFRQYIRWYWGLSISSLVLLGFSMQHTYKDILMVMAGILAVCACLLYLFVGYRMLYKEPLASKGQGSVL